MAAATSFFLSHPVSPLVSAPRADAAVPHGGPQCGGGEGLR